MVDPDTRHERDGYGLSGLTENEAREFHSYFTRSFLFFLAIAIIAHILTYIWAPWGVPA
ncbi:light-harvesting antenna LH1, beta subunit [Aurantiacibacter spongiae]|uniref:Light-harvesting protein n=1 Tax=Aurantiacibacter spongiae TaxID=2488860 RepID=A0A3N5CTW7_9SPHN|nr:light-harvesting antenna LH1, beta subunit [Aurantiacibacter spongiae]RPF71756.1 light-harvesting protein [Aurantiacibacter spongiae]